MGFKLVGGVSASLITDCMGSPKGLALRETGGHQPFVDSDVGFGRSRLFGVGRLLFLHAPIVALSRTTGESEPSEGQSMSGRISRIAWWGLVITHPETPLGELGNLDRHAE